MVQQDNDFVLVQVKFKPYLFEELDRKSKASGLDRSSYIKLLVAKVDIEAVSRGKIIGNANRQKRMFKEEEKGLGVAEGHALRALTPRGYNPILAVNELWIFNSNWVKRLVRQWCDKYDTRLEDFVLTKEISRVIIRAYFEIEDIVERKQGYTRGRYRLKPNYTLKDVEKLEAQILKKDTLKFDRLIKRTNLKLDKEEQKLLQDLTDLKNEKRILESDGQKAESTISGPGI